jgi:hypothetical protein
MEFFKRHPKQLENLGLCVAVVGYFAYVLRELKQSNELAIAEVESVLCQVDALKKKLATEKTNVAATCIRNAELEEQKHEQEQQRLEQQQQRQEQRQQDQMQKQRLDQQIQEQKLLIKLNQEQFHLYEQLHRPLLPGAPGNAKCTCDFELVIKTAKAPDVAIARCGSASISGKAILQRCHGPLLSKVNLLRQQRNDLVHNLKVSQLTNRAEFEKLTAEVLSAISFVTISIRNRDRSLVATYTRDWDCGNIPQGNALAMTFPFMFAVPTVPPSMRILDESDEIWFLKVLCGYVEAIFESIAFFTISTSAMSVRSVQQPSDHLEVINHIYKS